MRMRHLGTGVSSGLGSAGNGWTWGSWEPFPTLVTPSPRAGIPSASTGLSWPLAGGQLGFPRFLQESGAALLILCRCSAARARRVHPVFGISLSGTVSGNFCNINEPAGIRESVKLLFPSSGLGEGKGRGVGVLQGLSHRAERFRARECGSSRVQAILMGFFVPPPCSRKSADLVAPRRSAAVPQPCGTFPSRERSAGNSAGKRDLTAQPSPLSEFRDPQHELIHAITSGSFPHLGNPKYPK